MDLIYRINGDWFHAACRTPDEGDEYESYTEHEADELAGHGIIHCESCGLAVTPKQRADWAYGWNLSVN